MEDIDIENLRRVWRRVSEGSPGQESVSGSPVPLLRNLIEEETFEAAAYTLLIMKTRGSAAERPLRELRSEEERHVRRLQAEYFLRTGDTCPPTHKKPSAPTLLPALRRRWESEGRSAQRYIEASEAVGEPVLAALFTELAQEETHHAQVLRDLVGKLMR